ncbi:MULTISPECIES: hypothetical protein [unclassified Streptomyces]|uniref:hypothetical protein n=1 Tax=unclassified Streptomyces TaxID=2593676 RepID=UPI002E0F2173|nr:MULTISPECIES: hypothetical protein [unclassified Streptomyces]WSR22531.1 hypothetical protein OG573_27655 [Streptomyces sp. NBC_01205]
MQVNFAGPPQIRRAIHEASREVVLVMPRRCAFEEQVDLTAAHSVSMDSDVSVKVYVPPPGQGSSDDRAGRLAKLAQDGMEIHSGAAHGPRMVIIDRSVLIWARNQEDYSSGALIGHMLPFTPLLLRSLTAPQPTDEGGDPATEGLDSVSREVLRQLALGSKDEAAAREMGMALRTYRRMVARLMDSLDARSRFQAGYLAARQNLLGV